MINIKKLEISWFFKTIELAKSELLFDEWDLDNNLYIVKKGRLIIEKYTDDKKKELKELAILEKEDIFWEWALTNNDPKEVRISALENTELLKISWWKDFELFLKDNTKLWIELLSTIIESTNKRLLESNLLVTSSYALIKFISEISKFNNKNLFLIIDRLLSVLWANFIIYFEKVPGLKDYFVIKYDTREIWKMQEQVIQILNPEWFINLANSKWDDILLEPLKIANQDIGYLFIAKSKTFTEAQKKSIWTIAVSIAWFINQKQYFEWIKNDDYYEFWDIF